MTKKTTTLNSLWGWKLLFLFALTVSFTSCVKDNFDFDKLAEIRYNPNFAVPLVHSTLTINDILLNIEDSNGFITTESDQSLTVVYKSQFVSLDASLLSGLTLPSPSQNVNIILPPGAGTTNQSQTIPFNTSNATKIDSIGFKVGTLDFSFSGLSSAAQLTISIPTAKKNGVAFSQLITLPTANNYSFDLTGYTFDMTQVGGPSYNQFNINYSITTTAGFSGGTLNAASSMNNLQFSKMFGDLQNLSIADHKDTLDLSIFKNALGAASFSLVDPRINIILSNSFGLPLDINFAQLDGENPGTASYPILNTTPFPLAFISPNLSQVGQTLVDTTTLNNSNSQIASVINNTPKYVNYQIMATTNTLAPSQNNFVLDTSHFTADILVELPLYGKASGFSLVDTIPFELGQNLSDNVESGLIKLYNSNGFPIDLNLQVYFADSTYTRLDSLMAANQALLGSGTVNASTGRVTTPKETTLDITLDRTRLEKISTGKYLIIAASASTTNGGTTNVKFYSDNTLEVKLGIQLQVDIKAKP